MKSRVLTFILILTACVGAGAAPAHAASTDVVVDGCRLAHHDYAMVPPALLQRQLPEGYVAGSVFDPPQKEWPYDQAVSDVLFDVFHCDSSSGSVTLTLVGGAILPPTNLDAHPYPVPDYPGRNPAPTPDVAGTYDPHRWDDTCVPGSPPPPCYTTYYEHYYLFGAFVNESKTGRVADVLTDAFGRRAVDRSSTIDYSLGSAGDVSTFHMGVGARPAPRYSVDATFSQTLEDSQPVVSEPTHQHIDLFYFDKPGPRGTKTVGRLTVDHLLSDVLDTTCAMTAAPGSQVSLVMGPVTLATVCFALPEAGTRTQTGAYTGNSTVHLRSQAIERPRPQRRGRS